MTLPFAGRLVLGGLLASALAAAAGAQEKTLRAVSAFPEGTLFSSKFEAFVKAVNEKGKGVIRLNYLGGAPKVMPFTEVGKNLKDGVIDIMNSTGAYYTNVVPEGYALKLLEVPMTEARKNGAWALINKIHNEKLNAYYLARAHQYDEFHIYLNKEIKKPEELKGLKVRVTPVYRAMIEKIGGTAVLSAPSDVYTMLERNTVDGYGWPARGIFDFSWEKVTKFRIDPGFYNADIQFLVNLGVWNGLSDAQKKVLMDAGAEVEAKLEADKPLNEAERQKQAAAGIKAIRFSPEDEKRYLQLAYDAAWEAVIKASPQHGPEMRKLFSKK